MAVRRVLADTLLLWHEDPIERCLIAQALIEGALRFTMTAVGRERPWIKVQPSRVVRACV